MIFTQVLSTFFELEGDVFADKAWWWEWPASAKSPSLSVQKAQIYSLAVKGTISARRVNTLDI